MKAKLYHQFDFRNGIQIENERVAEWHNQIVNELSKMEKPGGVYSIASGNGICIGRRDFIDGEDRIQIIEVKNGYEIFDYNLNGESR